MPYEGKFLKFNLSIALWLPREVRSRDIPEKAVKEASRVPLHLLSSKLMLALSYPPFVLNFYEFCETGLVPISFITNRAVNLLPV
jgi:hypothetical protein